MSGIKNNAVFSKKIIIFDLDGTLTKSKTNIDKEMTKLLCRLLEKKKVAVIGGGSYDQFINQFLKHMSCKSSCLKKLLVMPLSGGSSYSYQDDKWKQQTQHLLSGKEKIKIMSAFKKSFREINYIEPKKIYGKVIEDRGSQITFSALGQRAPLKKKKLWHKKFEVRQKLRLALEEHLPNFTVRLGGLTSIDITKKGIDKAFGIQQVMKAWSLSKKEIVYIGDALYKGGNDYEAKRAGVATIEVKNAKATKTLIRSVLPLLESKKD